MMIFTSSKAVRNEINMSNVLVVSWAMSLEGLLLSVWETIALQAFTSSPPTTLQHGPAKKGLYADSKCSTEKNRKSIYV
jgi:hypothetical protein